MFPNVIHMIKPKRSRAEKESLITHTVEIWVAAKHIGQSKESRQKARRRARDLVNHCLRKPVAEHG